jgi:hypothetical protein
VLGLEQQFLQPGRTCPLILVIESDVPPNSTQVLGNGLLASSEVSA